MDFIPADFTSLAFFLFIILVVFSSFIAGVYFATRSSPKLNYRYALRVAIGTLFWLIVTSLMATNGVLERHPMPRLLLFIAALNIAGVFVALSPIGKHLATLPLQALVAFQGFRFPLELVLHQWAKDGTIPVTMTWTGSNFDVLSGLVALGAVPFIKHFRKVAWIPNILGFILLLNVMRVALFSSPLPFAWDVYPQLQLAFHFPYTLILSVGVAGALMGHVVLTRALLR